MDADEVMAAVASSASIQSVLAFSSVGNGVYGSEAVDVFSCAWHKLLVDV